MAAELPWPNLYKMKDLSLEEDPGPQGRGSNPREAGKKKLRLDVFLKRTKMIKDDQRKSQLSAAQCCNLTTWTDKQRPQAIERLSLDYVAG